ncbi:MAG: HAMP domain-containing histidine kinase, partial [bacterium]|nr:HAMP domain-containing histidine kinase [bacterium]
FALYRMVAVVVDYAERRTNFVSAVTHELKTPLTAIRMYGEMLRDGMVPDEGKRQRYYEIMTAESERLTRLLSNVLELARLERKTRTMNLVMADLAPVVEEAIAVLGPHAEKEGFTIRLDLAPERVPARFDRDALKQVLFNLLDNALKYSRKASEKEVIVSCRRQQDGVVLRVADRGPGVSRPHLKRIFEPFYRGESELTRTSKGTGIGLALVRGLVERMGGTVTGRNRGEGGFEVSVFLHNPSPRPSPPEG